MIVSKRLLQQFICLRHYHFIGHEYFIVRLKADESQCVPGFLFLLCHLPFVIAVFIKLSVYVHLIVSLLRSYNCHSILKMGKLSLKRIHVVGQGPGCFSQAYLGNQAVSCVCCSQESRPFLWPLMTSMYPESLKHTFLGSFTPSHNPLTVPCVSSVTSYLSRTTPTLHVVGTKALGKESFILVF